MVANQISILVIGNNDNWKQDIDHGRRNNQEFVSIPHAKLVEMLTYKAQLVEFKVILTEEFYTSKASLLDLNALPVYTLNCTIEHKYSGRRVNRGLYKSKTGRRINAESTGQEI